MSIHGRMQVLLAGLLLIASNGAWAQVFKCVDAAGLTSYSQTPCTADAREVGRWQGRVGAVMIPAGAAAATMRPVDVNRTKLPVQTPSQP